MAAIQHWPSTTGTSTNVLLKWQDTSTALDQFYWSIGETAAAVGQQLARLLATPPRPRTPPPAGPLPVFRPRMRSDICQISARELPFRAAAARSHGPRPLRGLKGRRRG